MLRTLPSVLVVGWILAGSAQTRAAEPATKVTIQKGVVNSVIIQRGDAALAVYGSSRNVPACDTVLLTHHRRDVAEFARPLVDTGADAVAPAAERSLIETPQTFWDDFATRRFHDYAQQSTKILTRELAVQRWVEPGEQVMWNDLNFQVVGTPGYTRGAVSYVTEIQGKRYAFTGDLIFSGGRLLDLYSFQDEIPSAKIGGYHGYGSRLAPLLESLERIAALKPDLLVPARGPVIYDPAAAISKLTRRVRSLYANYLSTNALNWYFKEERMTTAGRRVLGSQAEIKLMPYAVHQKAPDWVWEQGTSRLLISDDGRGFLLDCGNKRILQAVQRVMKEGLVTKIEGIFVTHYHDDHTDAVQQAAETFDCPVYALKQYSDILENPAAYHMPAMTANPIQDIRSVPDGQTMKWHEFEMTFRFYPGQAIYHGALLVKREGEKPIFFIGDSFSPSGIDDYCVLNRNLAGKAHGYQRCLSVLRAMKTDYWLVNQHIPYVFSFSPREMDYLESRYQSRIALLRDLFPYDDPNYGIDEQWAVFYPYGAQLKSGERMELAVKLTNHSPGKRSFQIKPRAPKGIQISIVADRVELEAGAAGQILLRLQADVPPGNYVITADVVSPGMRFSNWVEALITVE